MPKPRSIPPSSSSHDPFALFKAILIGIGLGFIAVLLVPYLVPLQNLKHEGPRPTESSKAPPARDESVKIGDMAGLRPSKDDLPASERPQSEKPPVSEEEKEAESASQKTQPEADTAAKGSASPATDDPHPGSASMAADNHEVRTAPEPVLVPAIELTFPKLFSTKEMTEALEPLLSFRVSEADAAAIKEAINAASKDQDTAANAALVKIGNPAGRKLAQWKVLRVSNSSLKEVLAFRAANPRFPAQALDPEVEKALFLSDAPNVEVLKFFANRKPLSGAGKACLGGALIETGERDRGISLIKQAWTRHSLDPAVQGRIESRYGNVLNEEDHNLRKIWLALKARKPDPAEEKASSASGGLKAAARLRARHSKGHSLHGGRHGKILKKRGSRAGRHFHRRHHAELTGPFTIENREPLGRAAAAITPRSLIEPVVWRRHRHASEQKHEEKGASKGDGKDKKASKPEETKPKQTAQSKAAANAFKLTKAVNANPASLLAKLKALRKNGEDDRLRSILRSLNPAEADLIDPERWWDFRRTEVRRALNDGLEGTAYAIAKTHGPLDDETMSEAEFLAGWIALRFLKEPQLAQIHFVAARQAKGSVRDEARSLYWLARTQKELGKTAEAESLFREAAIRFYTYYGQLARQSLRDGSACEFRPPVKPSKEEIAAFTSKDAYKAVMILKQLDLQPLLASFILDLARQVTDPEEMTLLMELTERVAPHHLTVRAAKIALLRGFPEEAYAFPALLPKFNPAGENSRIELPLLNALTRQESEFNSGSVSSVGARGLMQLMPQTARLVASTYKLKYEQPRLISDPSYNVTLGSAFLASLISGYDGSYVLALAAYNAGPGRIAGWIKQFGDPRDKSVDPIDWVERIPFTETRDYVERILEGTQLYRCRFENGKARMQLMQDLHRGRPGKMPDIADFGGLAEPEKSQ